MSTPGGPARVSIPAQGGFYDVDITQAPQAIRHLEDAAQELMSIREDLRHMSQAPNSYRDPVSQDAEEMLRRAADGQPGSFGFAIDEGLAEITSMIDKLRSAFAAYQRGDQHAGADLRQSP